MEQGLSYWQFAPESQYLDRKSARKKPLELLRHLIAFANAEGGQLVIGIENEKKIISLQVLRTGMRIQLKSLKNLREH